MSGSSAPSGAVVDEVQLRATLPGVSVSRLRECRVGENNLSAHTIGSMSKDTIRVVDDTIEAVDNVIRASEFVKGALREPEGLDPKERGPNNGGGELRPVYDDAEDNRTAQPGARHGLRLLFTASGILVISVMVAFVIGKRSFPGFSLAETDDHGRGVAITSVAEASSPPNTMPPIVRADENKNVEAAEVDNLTQHTRTQDAKAADSVKDRMHPQTQEITGHVAQLKPEQIEDLIERGSEFVALGDMNSARLLFERAAEARDSKAAFALAGTYDPIVLQELGVQVPAADLGKARAWYRTALEFGSPGAARRLELLASWRR